MKTEKAIRGLAIGGAIVGVAYLAYKVWAKPATEYCCPYCSACFATYEELVTHVQTAHPGERIPLPIDWD